MHVNVRKHIAHYAENEELQHLEQRGRLRSAQGKPVNTNIILVCALTADKPFEEVHTKKN